MDFMGPDPEDELTEEDKVRRALRVQKLKDDTDLERALERIGRTYIRRWMATQAEETAYRETLWFQLRALAMFRSDLTKMVNEGKILTEQERQEAEKARVRSRSDRF